MATQLKPPTHAQVTLRDSVENLSYLPLSYTYPQGGRVGCENSKGVASEMQASLQILAGKADVPGIS